VQHLSVLLREAVETVGTDDDVIYVDGMFGRGGHGGAVLERLSARGRLVALDRDPEAIASAVADATLAGDPRFTIRHAVFSGMASTLAACGITQASGVLLDLGVSSPQIDDPARGFSFRADGPLDMRMDPTRGESAAEFLARADERHLAEVIRDYGEERFALQVAKALVARRESGRPVRTTAELADVVARAVKTREAGQNPATRTFQALRIFVNEELEELERALSAALALLARAAAGRDQLPLAQDRIVKTFIARERSEFVPARAVRARARSGCASRAWARRRRGSAQPARARRRCASPGADVPLAAGPSHDAARRRAAAPAHRQRTCISCACRTVATPRAERPGAKRGARARSRQRAAEDRAAFAGDAAASSGPHASDWDARRDTCGHAVRRAAPAASATGAAP
jgi:16S rRNA (cytosine1402-N4)-methyltransferase